MSKRLAVVCLALVAITFAVYYQVADHEFISFDVQTYITGNPHVATGLSPDNIRWAFTTFEAGNWHPFTWLSHMLDVQLYGLSPAGHNLTNAGLHAASSALLLILLFRLSNAFWPSACVAFLFALHPMHVESVAWIAERKDVLSAFFWFLTLLCYREYAGSRSRRYYLLTLFCFLLGLMSKPMVITLPVVLLLLDFWPLGRLQPRQIRAQAPLLKEKIPFFAAMIVSALVTVLAQHRVGAVATVTNISLPLRLENALVSYAKYLGLTVWPHDLGIVYPFPGSIPLWQVLGSLLLLSLVSAAVLRWRAGYPYLLVGWFWFLVTLLPVIGLVQVGSQAMADRYSYLPSVGLFIMAAWGLSDLAARWRYRREICAAAAVVAIGAFAALTWRQLGYWQDSVTLYRHTLEVTRGNYLIHCDLGLSYAQSGDLDAATREYQESLAINPAFPQSHAGMGFVLAKRGDSAGAVREYQEALRLKPDYKEVKNNLGLALASLGNLDAAIEQYQGALRLSPDYQDARNNLGIALARKGDLDGAIRMFQEVLRTDPGDRSAQSNLERALSLKGVPH